MLVDNSPYCFYQHLTNGIPILPFFDNKKDNELMELADFLIYLNEFSDVRKGLDNHFKLNKLFLHRNPLEAFNAIMDE